MRNMHGFSHHLIEDETLEGLRFYLEKEGVKEGDIISMTPVRHIIPIVIDGKPRHASIHVIYWTDW